MFKIHHGLSQVSFLDLLHNYNENIFYSLRSKSDFQVPRINTTIFVPVIWNNIVIEIKWFKYFDIFKTEIRKWKPTNCRWRLCKTYAKI